jgi:hypothetical protein
MWTGNSLNKTNYPCALIEGSLTGLRTGMTRPSGYYTTGYFKTNVLEMYLYDIPEVCAITLARLEKLPCLSLNSYSLFRRYPKAIYTGYKPASLSEVFLCLYPIVPFSST